MGRGIKQIRKISNDRVRKPRKTKSTILIALEGKNKTEKLYFNNFDTGKQAYTITIAKGNDTDPLKLVKNLNNEIKKLGLDLKNGDKAYCVFDVDVNPQKNKIIEEAKKLAMESKIEIITSTPSIELWFLLHYEYTTAYLSNEEVIKKLKVNYPRYQKNSNIFPDIHGNVQDAIKNAKRLEQFQIDNEKRIGTVESNPNTEIYKIVEYLIENS